MLVKKFAFRLLQMQFCDKFDQYVITLDKASPLKCSILT